MSLGSSAAREPTTELAAVSMGPEVDRTDSTDDFHEAPVAARTMLPVLFLTNPTIVDRAGPLGTDCHDN